eukprot:TRINITY_DN59211_c0_g1_i1.p1 TRINITY_DN59211_c0_g1~~TRINITY_DN59211_c0_g1_i1.p1  ORF type:complete len:154 (+),score=28.27 TRINITY_DN59211_c0_g1_i1:43-462(+)
MGACLAGVGRWLPCGRKLGRGSRASVDELWNVLNSNADDVITRSEAMAFFKRHKLTSKLSVDAMFDEVDQNRDGVLSKEEWDNFWRQVRRSGYSDDEITAEVEEMKAGSAWMNWSDGREPSHFARSKKFLAEASDEVNG